MRKRKKGLCVHCGCLVSGGGDRHKKNHCPPSPGIRGEHRRQKKKSDSSLPARGVAVPGTKKTKKGAKKVSIK